MSHARYTPHYTVADYRQWEGDWELWNGIPVMMTPSPFGKHQKLATKIAHRLLSSLERTACTECEVACELDWVVADDLVVRPDVVVCCGQDTDQFIESPPTLIVEVLSESTARKDRTSKFELYAEQGVRFFFLVDSRDKSFEAFELHEASYKPLRSQSGRPGLFEISMTDHCHIDLDIGSL